MMVVGVRHIFLFFNEIYGCGATVASHVGTHHAIGIVSSKQILFNSYIVAPHLTSRGAALTTLHDANL
jgi:hypothetical protein